MHFYASRQQVIRFNPSGNGVGKQPVLNEGKPSQNAVTKLSKFSLFYKKHPTATKVLAVLAAILIVGLLVSGFGTAIGTLFTIAFLSSMASTLGISAASFVASFEVGFLAGFTGGGLVLFGLFGTVKLSQKGSSTTKKSSGNQSISVKTQEEKKYKITSHSNKNINKKTPMGPSFKWGKQGKKRNAKNLKLTQKLDQIDSNNRQNQTIRCVPNSRKTSHTSSIKQVILNEKKKNAVFTQNVRQIQGAITPLCDDVNAIYSAGSELKYLCNQGHLIGAFEEHYEKIKVQMNIALNKWKDIPFEAKKIHMITKEMNKENNPYDDNPFGGLVIEAIDDRIFPVNSPDNPSDIISVRQTLTDMFKTYGKFISKRTKKNSDGLDPAQYLNSDYKNFEVDYTNTLLEIDALEIKLNSMNSLVGSRKRALSI